ncbi:hypothetical protein [Streptomyces sp. NPDC051684]
MLSLRCDQVLLGVAALEQHRGHQWRDRADAAREIDGVGRPSGW